MKKLFSVLMMFCSLMVSFNAFAAVSYLKPSSVNNLNVYLENDSRVILTWDKALYADSYTISRKVGMYDEFELIASGVTELTYTDENADGYVYYEVTPCNKNGKGASKMKAASVYLKKRAAAETEYSITCAAGDGNYLYTGSKGDYTYVIYKKNDEGFTETAKGKYKTFDAVDILVNKGYMYILTVPKTGSRAVQIYDISEPEKPVRAGGFTVKGTKIDFVGDYLIAYGTYDSNNTLYDVSNIKNIRIVTAFKDVTFSSVYLKDNILYAGTTTGDLCSYNMINPKWPTLYSELSYSFTVKTVDLSIERKRSEANWKGIPKEVEVIDRITATVGGIGYKDGFAYLGTPYGLKVADVKHSRALALTEPVDVIYDGIQGYSNITQSGSILYVKSRENKCFGVFTAADAKKPVLTGYYVPDGNSVIADIIDYGNEIVTVNENGIITFYSKN